jgi:hypothetical protein
MYRRLYFTFPGIKHAQNVVNELINFNVTREHMHAMSNKNVDMGELPRASDRQRHDSAHSIGGTLWSMNLSIFGIALLLLIYSGFTQNYVISMIMLAIMFVTFTAGIIWTSVPDTPISEFSHAMKHNEILLMVDVPEKRVKEVGDKVHRHHPEAVTGGTSWMINAFDM